MPSNSKPVVTYPRGKPHFGDEKDWDQKVLLKGNHKPKYLPNNWMDTNISKIYPLVDEPERKGNKNEFSLLHAYQKNLWPKFAAAAKKQEDGSTLNVDITGPLYARLTNGQKGSFEQSMTVFIDEIIADSAAVVVKQKLLFNRARPYQIDTSLVPKLPKPGHPSYPSGHSTQSHACAFMICHLINHATDPNNKLPGIGAEVTAIANQIALNREIGGVHYPSDTRAGVQLARLIIDTYFQSDKGFKLKFQSLVGLLNKALR